METVQLTKEQIEAKIAEFVAPFKGAIMASIAPNQEVYLSTIPVVKIKHSFYALISRTAPHFDNLKAGGNAQIIFAEDEANMQSAFLRKRLSYEVDYAFSEAKPEVVEAFHNVHGKIVDMVLGLDFEFVELNIKYGKIILGPGQAYFIDQDEAYVGQDDGTEATRGQVPNHQ